MKVKTFMLVCLTSGFIGYIYGAHDMIRLKLNVEIG